MRLKKLDEVLKGEPVTDVVRTVSYRSDLFGRPFIEGLQESLRGLSEWTVGERELFAAFVSSKNHCRY
jgi:hypothetical protein